MPSMPKRSPAAHEAHCPHRSWRNAAPRHPLVPHDRFFRHIVDSMRNGVIAIRRDGTVALMNDEAYRIFALGRRDDIGRPFTDVLRERPDAIRALAGAFELSHLPNRAELRLEGHRPGDRIHALAGQRRPRATPSAR